MTLEESLSNFNFAALMSLEKSENNFNELGQLSFIVRAALTKTLKIQ